MPQPCPPRPESTSITLLDKLRGNEPGAYSRADFLYGPLVRGWCARRGLGHHDAEDVWQRVLQVVFQRIGEFRRDRPANSFVGWLRGITRLVLLEYSGTRQTAACGGRTDAGLRLGQVPEPWADGDDLPGERAALLHRALELVRSLFSDRDWEVFRLWVSERRSGPRSRRQWA